MVSASAMVLLFGWGLESDANRSIDEITTRCWVSPATAERVEEVLAWMVFRCSVFGFGVGWVCICGLLEW